MALGGVMRVRLMLVVAAVAVGFVVSLGARQVTDETVAGVRNFKRLETTVACAGATSAEALPALRKMGYASVINLRLASEAGADIVGSMAAAQAAGLNYVHIPFNGQSPDPAAADRFLAEVVKPANQPAFVHCAGGGRAATMWLIKRIAIDKWDVERASAEATALGMSNQTLRQWAIEYAKGK
jgi:uncharacterized protein (TIGR01244 family)